MPDYNHNPSDPDAIPNYGGFLGIGAWSIQDWMTWYYVLLTKYSLVQAREYWNNCWNYQGFMDTNYSWAKYDPVFNKFLKDNELNGNSNVIADTEVTAVNSVKNLLQAIEDSSKTLPILLTTCTVAAALAFVIYVGREATKKK